MWMIPFWLSKKRKKKKGKCLLLPEYGKLFQASLPWHGVWDSPTLVPVIKLLPLGSKLILFAFSVKMNLGPLTIVSLSTGKTEVIESIGKTLQQEERFASWFPRAFSAGCPSAQIQPCIVVSSFPWHLSASRSFVAEWLPRDTLLWTVFPDTLGVSGKVQMANFQSISLPPQHLLCQSVSQGHSPPTRSGVCPEIMVAPYILWCSLYFSLVSTWLSKSLILLIIPHIMLPLFKLQYSFTLLIGPILIYLLVHLKKFFLFLETSLRHHCCT